MTVSDGAKMETGDTSPKEETFFFNLKFSVFVYQDFRKRNLTLTCSNTISILKSLSHSCTFLSVVTFCSRRRREHEPDLVAPDL